MKKTVFLVLVVLAAIQTVGFSQGRSEGKSAGTDAVVADSVEYSIVILDPGFDTWLIGKPQIYFYSNDYYREKNLFLVSEWNLRYMSDNNGLYESYIDYNPFIDYDIEFNYRLYYFFKYFEATNNITLAADFR